jgi:hypothetical protein
MPEASVANVRTGIDKNLLLSKSYWLQFTSIYRQSVITVCPREVLHVLFDRLRSCFFEVILFDYNEQSRLIYLIFLKRTPWFY